MAVLAASFYEEGITLKVYGNEVTTQHVVR